jgi:basic membrane lipoprotein Med (substrate-binding protein (PBP1-ABC) superfamily)
MKRFIGMVVALIGIATLVFGIIFIIQSNTGKQTVADEVKPIALSDVNPKYDAVSASQTQLMAAEEPKIQAGQAQPSAMYNYLSAQRALLGLAKANIGLTGFVMMSGTVDIILGIALILMGMTLFMKQTA